MFYLFSFKTCLDLKSLPMLQVEDVDVAAEDKDVDVAAEDKVTSHC